MSDDQHMASECDSETGQDTGQAEVITVPPKPKQYLMVCDEMNMALLARLCPGMLFVQVEGMAVKDNENYMLLVNPITKPDAVA